uniref:NADH-ubiquinone oxidoreductase chain 5 n=1 Tax=Kumanoa ambigua TaxID=644273 RepID=A0A343UXT8_9FLOR|nr:NADH dehydrogenase subunit 5 [Kumanoa ambigua]AVK39495.1 NADH dehydrogenase subunit 5 [Kumanoa ambigua]
MYLLVIVLPLFSAIISGLAGRWIGYYGSSLLSNICVFLSMFFSFFIFYEVGLSGLPCFITLSTWVNTGNLLVNWGFLFDSLTSIMIVVVTVVSSLVHIYSVKYMEEDPHVPRFMAYLGIFTFFMLVLVTADNLIQLFLGWEGVGLSSYLLINFWYTRLAANQSAIKALLVNRVGDFSLILGILVTFCTFHSVEYNVLFACASAFSNYYCNILGVSVHSLSLITFFLFIGAVGKSAQLGLHMWLPDAMEGPTPVSALIHAATMVTAGVFLMIRFSIFLEYAPFSLFVLTVFGSLTALFAAMTGTFQNDLKRVIAYSTCSQLGYMILACGLSNYHVSIFHLSNHAFFKALLFLSAGSVIHATTDEQDMRRMGSLALFLPVTYSLMLSGSMSLIGFPFLTGFYSKDFILELSQVSSYFSFNLSYSFFACWLGTISVFFTAFYSFRLLYLTFLNNSNIVRIKWFIMHESSLLMLLPLLILGLGSIFIGYLTKDMFIGQGSNFWGTSIYVIPQNSYILEAEFLLIHIKWLPFFLSVLGIFFVTLLHIFPLFLYKNVRYNVLFYQFAFILNKKWYWDKVYNIFLVKPLLIFGYLISFKNIDRGFIELLGPFNMSVLIPFLSRKVIELQTGQLNHYIFFIVYGFLIFFTLFVPGLIFDIEFNSYLIGIFCILLVFI